MNNKKHFVLAGILGLAVCSDAAESSDRLNVILSSPQYPSAEVLNAGIRDINRINAVHSDGYRIRSLNEEQKVITTVPPAIWRGGCFPTASSMLMMYWEIMGFHNLIPYNTSTSFLAKDPGGPENIQWIASDAHMEDYFYPDDSTTVDIIPDRSELPYYLREPNCMADILRASFSKEGYRQGFASATSLSDFFVPWVLERNPDYDADGDYWFLLDEYVEYNPDPELDPWEVVRREIDDGHPVCGFVNATKGNDTVDHAVVIVGYSIRDGVRYYAALNTWTTETVWYEWKQPAVDTVFGVAVFVTIRFDREGELSARHFEPNVLYKFYDRSIGAYFFTAFPEEAAAVANQLPNWKLQGPSFRTLGSPAGGNQPIYRFLNKYAHTHFYTISPEERDNVIANLSEWYQYEGVAFFGRTDCPDGFSPVFRFWLDRTGSHYFTDDADEREYLVRYADPEYIQYEGVAWYASPYLTESHPNE